MPKLPFKPYKNESESLQIADMTIENRLDRVSIFGSIDLTKDKEGLDFARELKRVLDLTVAELENADLPEKIELLKSKTVLNPFA